jgi:hypothetical protein
MNNIHSKDILLFGLAVSAVFFSVLMSGCIEGTQLVGQSELTAVNGQKQEITTQEYNLTVDTSAKLLRDGLSKKIVVSGNITNDGTTDVFFVTLKSSFHHRNGGHVSNTPIIGVNFFSLRTGETKQFEMEYRAGYPNYILFDLVKHYKISIYV